MVRGSGFCSRHMLGSSGYFLVIGVSHSRQGFSLSSGYSIVIMSTVIIINSQSNGNWCAIFVG